MKRKQVVVMGGGTGLSVLLRGLKQKPFDITAIVTVGDDGGSSGRLRQDLQVPPPGDVRNVILALADTEPLMEKLFQYRFTQGEGLEGHSVGNLMLAAMTEITGDFSSAIREMKRVLAVKGEVLPICDQAISLQAEMEDGEIIQGESNIPLAGKKIKRISLIPPSVAPTKEVIEAIQRADMIILGPGSLYTSLIPHLLMPEVICALKQSTAKKVYISNVMTQRGETDEFTVFDHLKAMYDHVGEDLFDIVLVNNKEIPPTVLANYQAKQSHVVQLDREKMEKYGFTIIEGSFVLHDKTIRHDARRIATCLEQLMEADSIKKKKQVNSSYYS